LVTQPGYAGTKKESFGNISKCPVGGVAASTPRVVTEFFNCHAFVVGNGFKTALIVRVDVVHGAIAFFVEGIYGKQTIAAA